LAVAALGLWTSAPDTTSLAVAALGVTVSVVLRPHGRGTKGSIALVFAAATTLKRLPKRWINIPNREYWLATDERREVAMNRIAAPMAWIGLLTAALLAVAVEFTIRANLHGTNFANDVFIVMMVGYLLLVAAITIWMIRDLAQLANISDET